MRRLIALAVIVAASAGLAGTVPAAAAPEAPAAAVPTSTQVCTVIEVGTFGPNPNLVGLAYSGYMNFYGLIYVRCCFYDQRNGSKFMALYLTGWSSPSNPTWHSTDPYCRN